MKQGLILLFVLVTFHAFGQNPQIDSLKKRLPFLSGAAIVDCLNDISNAFVFDIIHSDSALKYSHMAYDKADEIGYKKGKIIALIMQGETEGKLLGLNKRMEAAGLEAVTLLDGLIDKQTASYAYRTLSSAYTLQGNFDEGAVTAKRAMHIAMLSGDKRSIGWAFWTVGFNYGKRGHHWKAYENLIECQRIGKEVKDSFLTSLSLAFIARSFNYSGDPQKALDYYFEALQYVDGPWLLLWPHLEDIGFAYLKLKKFDSAIYYQQKHWKNVEQLTDDVAIRKKFSNWFQLSFSLYAAVEQQQFEKVIQRLEPAMPLLRKGNDALALVHALTVLGKAYEGNKQYTAAVPVAREVVLMSERAWNNTFRKEGYSLLASVFQHLKQNDSALHYFQKYVAIKDSINNEQFLLRTGLYAAAAEADKRFQILNKNKQLTDQQLAINKKELQKQSQLKNILWISLLLFLMFAALVVRNFLLKHKNDKLHFERSQLTLKQKALELEMQALRAQMNPHFIFNCLSAIDNLVQTSQPDKATSYLSRFAKLIRHVLDSSKNNLVPFQKDFETVRLYLEMEQFRCNNKFDYQLNADPQLLDGDYKVPPLIIQPFVENAIHHGLLNKGDANRLLRVTAHLQNEQIIYSVTDNGVGRKRASVLKELNKPGQQSYGISITEERIHLHNRNAMANDVLITDLEVEGLATGTQAVVKINCSTN